MEDGGAIVISKYGIFCKAAEHGSFTKTAEELGYSQSAVSQSVKALEQELDCVLFHRLKSGLTLTRDGEQYFPYIQAIFTAEQALARKNREMSGLEDSVIHIAETITVNRTFLLPLIKEFKELYPSVRFMLHHGFYIDVEQRVLDGTADLGFTDLDSADSVHEPLLFCQPLFNDEMMAVLPQEHPLAAQDTVSLSDLASYPFILLYDERDRCPLLPREFQKRSLTPQVEYKMSDDDSILTMVEQGFGISALFQLFLYTAHTNLAIRPIEEHPMRTLSLVWSNWDTMPLAAKRFAKFVQKRIPSLLEELKHAKK